VSGAVFGFGDGCENMTMGEHIIASLKDAGVRRLFGMPGGGSNADLVEAAGKFGLPFSLAHTEAASAFMASAPCGPRWSVDRSTGQPQGSAQQATKEARLR
jgi:hypothetical protein